MGVFSNINGARGSRGNYVVQVLRCKMVESFKKNQTFIAELRIVETDNEDLSVGQEPSFVINLDGEYPDLALGNVADFMRAGMASLGDQHDESRPEDIDEVEINEAEADSIAGEDNLLAGVFLTAKAWNHETRKGNDFTRIKWGVPDDVKKFVSAAA
jgi:hypothetical protein